MAVRHYVRFQRDGEFPGAPDVDEFQFSEYIYDRLFEAARKFGVKLNE